MKFSALAIQWFKTSSVLGLSLGVAIAKLRMTMAAEVQAGQPQTASWQRALRPLLWWLLFVLAVLGFLTHRRLLEKTRLTFAVTLEGRAVEGEAAAAWDGVLFRSGQRVSLGRHLLAITHPKGKSFSTNLVVWYGGRDLGTIRLVRTKGVLALSANPIPERWAIRGPDFTTNLDHIAGMTLSVPTDLYRIEARFQHTNVTVQVDVAADVTTTKELEPALGAARITCDQVGATFELSGMDGRSFEQGTAPALVTEIPAGVCRMNVTHHGNRKQLNVNLAAGQTNEMRIEFQYGAAVFETQPAGATLVHEDRTLGVTPLTLDELPAGAWSFTLARADFEPVRGRMQIIACQTNHYQTSLLSHQYVVAMQAAQEYLQVGRHDRALASAGEALKHKPDDAAAQGLLREATGYSHLARARSLGEHEDFKQGLAELQSTLESLPDNAEARTLVADFTKREAEQLAAQRQRHEAELVEQRFRAKKEELHTAFNLLLKGFEETDKFSEHELGSSNTVEVIIPAIREALTNSQPTFRIVRIERPRPDLFALQARQLAGVGYRDCFVIVGELRAGETEVLFKVVEYDHLPKLGLLGGILSAAITPLADPSGSRAEVYKRQVEQGAPMVEERLRKALGK